MHPAYFIDCPTTPQQFEQAAYAFLAAGNYTPDDIFEEMSATQQLLQLPFYYYQIGYEGKLKAETGHKHTDTYIRLNKKKQRSITTWHPHYEYITGETDVLLYAGNSHAAELIDLMQATQCSASHLKIINPGDTALPALQASFVYSMEAQWAGYGSAIALARIDAYERERRTSMLLRDIDIQVKLHIRQKRSVLIPCWLLKYTYNDADYWVAADATNLARITGTRPTDQRMKEKIREKRRSGWITGVAASAGAALVWATAFQPPALSIFIGGAGIAITWLITEMFAVAKLKRATRERLLYRKALKGK
jgi:hypothetical protein